MTPIARDEIVASADRFAAFFRELDRTFVERRELLAQIGLGLLSRQHVLMTGPPGNAKSNLAHAVLGRIVHEETAAPSVFARQITESTVQTDLIGPVDFKTLMDTGRTEHFTEDGMLGAVHAFLDEVFDGRDMLLRSTLNVLHEREFKQGTRTTRGKIECAIMTTNRYLAEILENERLVAFVDRITFLCFVPKGFASGNALEAVLSAQVAGRQPPPLGARLTIEDIDRLQTLVDQVFIDDETCGRLAKLVRAFEAEIATARRADPSFTPSRYLSTRTVVRLGNLLRSICVHDWIMRDRERRLEVLDRDLPSLSLGMTLSGPSAHEAAALLEQETDPRERRQLGIVRIEREAFDRALATVPRRTGPPPAPQADEALLAQANDAALAVASLDTLLALAQPLALAATAGRRSADAAAERLGAIGRELERRALRTSLNPFDAEAGHPLEILDRLQVVADQVERSTATRNRWVGRWVRTQALRLVHVAFETVPLGAGGALAGLTQQLAHGAGGGALWGLCTAQVDVADRLDRVRDRLRREGVDEPDRAAHDTSWRAGAQALADRLAPLAAAAVRNSVARAPAVADGDLRWLVALEPDLRACKDLANRLGALGADGQAFFQQAVRGAVAPLVQAGIEALAVGGRQELLQAMDELHARMARAHLTALLTLEELVTALAGALARAAAREPRPALDPGPGSFEGYRALRRAMPRATLAGTLVELCAHLVPDALASAGGARPDGDALVARVAALVRTLPEATRRTLAAVDRAYVEAPLTYLERWWAGIAGALPREPRAAIAALASSRFLEVTQDEGALARFKLELRLASDVLGPAALGGDGLAKRIDDLAHASVTASVACLAAVDTTAR
jgi:MoxR-like ATPase